MSQTHTIHATLEETRDPSVDSIASAFSDTWRNERRVILHQPFALNPFFYFVRTLSYP